MPADNTETISRLAACAHYVIGTAPQGSLGKIKLNKTLWFADRDYYQKTGRQITGDTWLRFPQGPVAGHLQQALDSLTACGHILIRKEHADSFEHYCFISLTEPDMTVFKDSEVAALARAIDLIAPLSARQASKLSHDRTWQIFNEGEAIPLYATLAADTRQVTQEDIAWAEAQDWE